MKLKLVRITKIICFCMVAVLMVGGLTDLLKPKWLENRWVSAKTNKSFYELQDNSAEVVFFGACFRFLGLCRVPGIGNESHDHERLDRPIQSG